MLKDRPAPPILAVVVGAGVVNRERIKRWAKPPVNRRWACFSLMVEVLPTLLNFARMGPCLCLFTWNFTRMEPCFCRLNSARMEPGSAALLHIRLLLDRLDRV